MATVVADQVFKLVWDALVYFVLGAGFLVVVGARSLSSFEQLVRRVL